LIEKLLKDKAALPEAVTLALNLTDACLAEYLPSLVNLTLPPTKQRFARKAASCLQKVFKTCKASGGDYVEVKQGVLVTVCLWSFT
jgi:hypothetical protein